MSRLPDSEVLGLLNGESVILDVAREISAILREEGLHDVGLVGGLAVYLHGHRRVTNDIDLYTSESQRLADVLNAHGFLFNAERREFVKKNAPVHLVTSAHIPQPPREIIEIDGIRVVSLRDLIEIKLRSGLAKVTRAQDLADVIALIRVHTLSREFAQHLSKDLRAEFRNLVKAVRKDEADRS